MKKNNPYEAFLQAVRGYLPKDRIYTDLLRRFAWGTDASFYRLVPQIVIRTENEDEVAWILTEAHARRLPVTFRAAGTSLSGQALSDSILVVAGKNWEKSTYNSDTTVTLQPGIVGAEVNRRLAPHGRKFGPDPASIGSSMVGGIVMNNASGMSCGTHANSDRCLISARMVLADGTVLDTASGASRSAFRQSHPELVAGIEKLRDEIRSDEALSERIRHKYSIKNVTGLNILPFITYSDPFDIIAHLLVGSEGTLAFLSEVRMTTLPVAPFKASAMIYFPSIRMAAEAVVAMRKEKITAAELLDIRSLIAVNDPHLDGYGLKGRVFRRNPDIPAANDPAAEENPMVRESRFRPFPAADRPEDIGLVDLSDLTAVLTQTEAETHEELLAQIARIQTVLAPFGVDVAFSEDPAVTAGYWAIRAGIFPAVGGLRKEGTTCLIEDVAFHIEDLPAATEDLSALLDRHGYDDSCIYGHALEGNFHFIINQSFATDADVRRYEAMIRDVAEMVVGKYDGSLKAEHGTGRNMAPFVRLEWGDKAFSVMQRVKALFDPDGILNPGVIFNDDPECFIKDFKALPVLRPDLPAGGIDDAVREAYHQINKCIECGFCEVNCVSCGFTLSSRTRIAVQREIARLRASLAAGTASGKTLGKVLGKVSGILSGIAAGKATNLDAGEGASLDADKATSFDSDKTANLDAGKAMSLDAGETTSPDADKVTGGHFDANVHSDSDMTAGTEMVTGEVSALAGDRIGDMADGGTFDGMDRATRKRWLQELERGYRYYGDETCAADGLCSTSCPMGINVAEMTHQLRRERISGLGNAAGELIANHFHGAKTAIRGVLHLASLGQALLGTQTMSTLGTALHKGLALPLWTPATPRAYNATRAISSPNTAQNGHELGGNELSCPKTAPNGHEHDGCDLSSPKTDQNGHDLAGSDLSSPKTAQNGHEHAGSAISCPNTAQNGHEHANSATSCRKTAQNGHEHAGNDISCPNTAQNGHEHAGSAISCPNTAQNGHEHAGSDLSCRKTAQNGHEHASSDLSSPNTAQNGHELAGSDISCRKTAQNGHETGRETTRPKVVYFPSCLNQMMGLPTALDKPLRASDLLSPEDPLQPASQPGARAASMPARQTAARAASMPAPQPNSRATSQPAILPRRPLAEETVDLLHKAGYEVIFPERMDSLCCGMIWESKGMPETADRKTAELEEALWRASAQGKYPVLCDQSPCLHRMRARIHRMKLYEPAEFIHDFLMDCLNFRPTDETVAVHVTCSTRLMGLGDKLIALARRCSTNVIVPEGVGCCGFAGDKGMTHPELNAYALRKLRAQVNPDAGAAGAATAGAGTASAAAGTSATAKTSTARTSTAAGTSATAKTSATAGYSNSRTCEIGLTTNSGIPYQSIVYLVNACTDSKDSL